MHICHRDTLHHTFHMVYHKIKPRPPWSETKIWLPKPWHGPNNYITKGKFILSLYSTACNPHLHKFLLMVSQFKKFLGVWSRQGQATCHRYLIEILVSYLHNSVLLCCIITYINIIVITTNCYVYLNNNMIQ